MEIRLNKYISDAGICSRREADRLIESGKVTVDGKRAEMGMKVTSSQVVCVGKKEIRPKDEIVLLAVNKPVGIVCTEDKREKHNIIQFLKYPTRITYIGRLDKDSEGLLLMTNHGDIINKMMRSGNQHEKEYKVTVNKPITPEFIERMSNGVPILDTVTRKCEVEMIGKYKFRIILTQGLNRQIRRMCEYLGYKVTKLERVRVMNIELGDLKPGEYHKVTEKEMTTLFELIKDSSNETVIPKE
jgi:23S rRNA pseudouridine2604 synthase